MPPIAGPKIEPQPEGGADDAHALRPVGGRGDVGGIGEGGGDVAGHGAGKGAGGEQRPEAVGKGQPDVRQGDAGQADHQDRAAADAVAQPSPQRCRQELGERVHRHQHADLGRRRMEVLAVERQQRDDQTEADEVDEDDEEENGHARVIGF